MNTTDGSPVFNIGSFDDSLTQLHSTHYDHEKFCTPDSLKASSNYINIMLTSYGYPVPLVFDSIEAVEQCKIVNCLYTLLQDRKNDANEREDLTRTINEIRRTHSELENQVVQLKREVKLKEKNCSEIRAKSEADQNTYKEKILQNTRLKEEISKAKNNMQYMKTQYAHESSKHEQELAKLQDRLVKLMNNQYKSKVATLEMNSHYGTTIDNTADEDAIVQLRKRHTEIQQKTNLKEREMRFEIEHLKTSLIHLYTNTRRILEEQIARFDNMDEDLVTKRDTFAETQRFRLPEDCGGGKEVIQLIQDLLDRLKQEWISQVAQQSNQVKAEDLAEKDELIQQLDLTVKELVESIDEKNMELNEIKAIHEKYQAGGFFDTLYPDPNDACKSDSDDSAGNLDNDDYFKFRLLKKQSRRDQRKVTQSAIELGYQRQQLEAERWAFQEMKRTIEMREILQDEPVMPDSQSSASTTQSFSIQQQRPESSRSHSSTSINNRARKRLKPWLGNAPSFSIQ